MKKFLALLLCVSMLMVGVVAQAESGYVFLKTFFSDSEKLGAGFSQSTDMSGDSKWWLTAIFDFRSESIGLMGCNARGKGEGTIWDTENSSEFVAYLETVLTAWSLIEENMDEGYTFHVMFIFDDDSNMSVNSEAEAQALLSALQDN